MDELQDWEVYDIYSMLQYADASQWEQTRWLMYVVAQVNSRKHLKLSDILQFPWDSDGASAKTTISNEDVERLRKKAKLIENDLLKEMKNGSDTKRNNKT